MDASEFEKRHTPNKKKSKLKPFRDGTLQLNSKGYADRKIKDLLAINGIEVTRQAVGQFLKKSTQVKTIVAQPISKEASKPPITVNAAPVVKETEKTLILDDTDEDFPDPVLTPEQIAQGFITPLHFMTPRKKEIRRKQRGRAQDKLFEKSRVSPLLMEILERQDKERQQAKGI